MYDVNNNVVTSTLQAITYTYDISFVRFRPSTLMKLFQTSAASGITITTAQEHSPALKGTFIINLNGVPLSVYDPQTRAFSTSIQVANDIWYIYDALRKIYLTPSLSQFTYQTRETYQMPDQLEESIIR
jgi:hypothetical protein